LQLQQRQVVVVLRHGAIDDRLRGRGVAFGGQRIHHLRREIRVRRIGGEQPDPDRRRRRCVLFRVVRLGEILEADRIGRRRGEQRARDRDDGVRGGGLFRQTIQETDTSGNGTRIGGDGGFRLSGSSCRLVRA